jgi:hypothetical protein
MKIVKKYIYSHQAVAYQIEELERDYPGPINNKPIMKDYNKYIREDEAADPTNFVIKRKTQEGVNYKMIPKECWDIIFKRFGGGPEIVRVKDNDMYSYSRKYTLKFTKVI